MLDTSAPPGLVQKIEELAEKFGVHRDTVRTWLARYEGEGLDGVLNRSHRPRLPRCQTPGSLTIRIHIQTPRNDFVKFSSQY
jgi:transposase-like protein